MWTTSARGGGPGRHHARWGRCVATFPLANDIGYPLLSDEGGKVVAQFGLLNPNIPPNPRQAPGIPFAGHLLLTPNGRVLAKAFSGDLRHRATGAALVTEAFGPSGEPAITLETDELIARISLSSDRLLGGQEATVVVDVELDAGWHVYASEAPALYAPFAIEFDHRDGLIADPQFSLPAPRRLELPALGETLPVYDGRVRINGRLRLQWSPP